MNFLRSWKVVVRWPEARGASNVWYIVAFSKKSAIRQAKAMAGYPVEERESRAGIVECEWIEEFV